MSEESKADEIQRLQREIAMRQRRLQYLVLGDPMQSVNGGAISTLGLPTPAQDPTNG